MVSQSDLLADTADDFVKAVFGVHGQQAINDLQDLEKWTDPRKDIADSVARLINKTGLDLLTRVTGIDAAKEFESARRPVLDALKKWYALPGTVSGAIWNLLGKLDGSAATEFKRFLSALAAPDPQKRRLELARAIADAAFGDTPQGQFLAALTNTGLLALTNELDRVQKVAADTLAVLDGGVVKRLQAFINEKLDLDKVRKAVSQNDFNALDGWLVKRLSDFLGKDLELSDLNTIKDAINAVIAKRQDIYDKACKALANRYSIDFATTYAKNTADTALLDVSFDLSEQGARDMFKEVVAESNLDNLLVKAVAGVTLNEAALSHDIRRTGSVQLHMPFFSFDSRHVNDSLAKLTTKEDSGRVLIYEVGATDTVTVKNRYMSELSILGSLKAVNGQIQVNPDESKSIAYQLLQVMSDMKLADLEYRTAPFIETNLSNLFAAGGKSSLHMFYADLGRTIGNGGNDLRDVLVNMQVSMPGSILAGWFQQRDARQLAMDSMNMSRRLQAKLRWLIPFCYFQNIDNLQPNPTAASLLVWSSLPVSTSVDFQDGEIRQLNTDKGVFWNYVDVTLRRAMVEDRHTTMALVCALLAARTRLLEAGNPSKAAFFNADQAGSFKGMARSDMGDMLLDSLLFTEAEIIGGATGALEDLQDMLADAASAPAKAISHFADFGAGLTDTFNHRLKSTYGDDSLRALGSVVLLEASMAIDLAFQSATPNAMLELIVLKEKRAFRLDDFLTGKRPPAAEIALTQTLVSASVQNDLETARKKLQGRPETFTDLNVPWERDAVRVEPAEPRIAKTETAAVKKTNETVAGTSQAESLTIPARPLRVFLCHSSEDKRAVGDLYRQLRADALDPWFDEESLLPGQIWREEIAKAVRTSDVVIVCLSHNSITKEGYVQKEINNALDVANEKPEGTIFLIPLRLEACDVPVRLAPVPVGELFSGGRLREVDTSSAHTRGYVNPLKSLGCSCIRFSDFGWHNVTEAERPDTIGATVHWLLDGSGLVGEETLPGVVGSRSRSNAERLPLGRYHAFSSPSSKCFPPQPPHPADLGSAGREACSAVCRFLQTCRRGLISRTPFP